ncbi:MAG: KTSC domain-containing protein [Tolypothrix brevis GSE-NOS-MK-07-07A]|jgi:hypothetical protein|nr:KTSC domain-containing protein [Tolypothrix brevis GSE-NOS-MK-07-07A]
METQAVNSSTIKSIGYEKTEEICQVEFLDGGVYWYFGVDNDLYQAFLKAKSKGQYLSLIKSRHQFQKIK